MSASIAGRAEATLPRLVINGKFTCCRTTGVQRVAEELVRALDLLVEPGEVALWTPPGGRHLGLRHIVERSVGVTGVPLHLWEQVVLPWQARRLPLLHLAGAAPAWHRHSWCTFHDAAPFDVPQAYTRAFGLWYRWLFRRMARRARGLITVSEFSRGRLAHWLRMPPGQFVVVPNCADHHGLSGGPAMELPVGLAPGRYFLAVASASPAKGLDVLREAHGRLGPDAPPLVLVGGRHAAVFRGRSTAAPAQTSCIVELGPVDDGRLQGLYAGALALVSPSRYEGFGLPPLEAMRAGCPVVISGADGLRETCGDAALVCDPLTVTSLTNALARVAADAHLRARLVAAGRERAACFRWADSARRLQDALRGDGVLT